MSRIWAVVPAAGSGSRFSSTLPKQFSELLGRPLLDWSVQALLRCERVHACVLALAEEESRAVTAGDAALEIYAHPRVMVCAGGASRAESVAAGLQAIDGNDDDWVLVHDAARPCLPLRDLENLIDRCLVRGIGGVLAQPVAETLKRAATSSLPGEDAAVLVDATVDRDNMWRAQTPQMFPLRLLRESLAKALRANSVVTDEASAMELAGYPVQLVEGSAANLKVTYPEDLALAKFWIQASLCSEGVVGSLNQEPG